MIAVYRDTRSFLDFKRIETYLAAEYHILSFRAFHHEMSSQNQFNYHKTHGL
jgi:hypothetical protein